MPDKNDSFMTGDDEYHISSTRQLDERKRCAYSRISGDTA